MKRGAAVELNRDISRVVDFLESQAPFNDDGLFAKVTRARAFGLEVEMVDVIGDDGKRH